MPPKRRARSASRKSTPTSPPKIAASTKSPRQERQSNRQHVQEALQIANPVSTARRGLAAVPEEPTSDGASDASQLDHLNEDDDNDNVQLEDGAQGLESDSVEDATSSSTGSEEFAELDRDLMIDNLPAISQDADTILSFARANSREKFAREVEDPTSSMSKRFSNLGTRLQRNLEPYPKRMFLREDQILRKLRDLPRNAGEDQLGSGDWRPDYVLAKVNVACLMTHLFGDKTGSNALDRTSLTNRLHHFEKFPTPFQPAGFRDLSEAQDASGSRLGEATDNLSLSILTQCFIEHATAHTEGNSFSPEGILKVLLFEEDEDPDSADPKDFEQLPPNVRARATEILGYFKTRSKRANDLKRLRTKYSWESFLDQAVNWADLMKAELDKNILSQGGVDAIVDRLINKDFPPPLPVPEQELAPQRSDSQQAADRLSKRLSKGIAKRRQLKAQQDAIESEIPDDESLSAPDPPLQARTPSSGQKKTFTMWPLISRKRNTNAEGNTDETATTNSPSRARQVAEIPQSPDDVVSDQEAHHKVADEVAGIGDDEVEAEQTGAPSTQQVSKSPLIAGPMTNEALGIMSSQAMESNKENIPTKATLLKPARAGVREDFDSESPPPPQKKRTRQPSTDGDDDFETDQRSPAKRSRMTSGKQKAHIPRRSPSPDPEDQRDSEPELPLQSVTRQHRANHPGPSSQPVRRGLPGSFTERSPPPSTAPARSNDHETIKVLAHRNVELYRAAGTALSGSHRQYQALGPQSQIRRAWSPLETQRLLEMIGDHGCRWSLILKQDAKRAQPALQDRNQVQLKDKARNMKLDYLKAHLPLPENFEYVTISKYHKVQLRQLGIPLGDEGGEQDEPFRFED